jgi:hypothetical protein
LDIQLLALSSSSKDVWTYTWGSSVYSCKKAYNSLAGTYPSSILFKWMWQSRAQPKHLFFFWLLLKDRLNTRFMLHRKKTHLDSYHCVLCVEHVEEDIVHLFSTALSAKPAGPSWVLLGTSPWIIN